MGLLFCQFFPREEGGPGGGERIGATQAGPEIAALTGPDGHIAYAFDGPGRYTFAAGPPGAEAPSRVVVEVE